MKQKIKLIAVLLVLMLFANFYLAIGQNMDRYITLTVKQGEMIMLAFTADSDNTPVKVVSGTKDTTVMVSATIFNRREYYAQTTTMTVYGNVACFDCGKNKTKVTGVDFSHNTALTYLDCPDNSLTTLDVSKNTALTSLDCSDNSLTTLDVSKNTTLKSLYCSDNSLTTLDVSKNTTLKSLYCSDNSLSSLDISKNTKLVRLECNNTLLTTLDVSKHPDLKYLYCSQNSLTTLNISLTKELTELGGNSNLLTVLDVSNNTKLYELNCSQNSLTELNISQNTALKYLYCANNTLTALDISSNILLYELSCSNNSLTDLDISKNTALKKVYCYNNNFSTEALDDIFCSLPERQSSDQAKIYPLYNSNDAGYSTVMATNKQNAITKNWKVQYGSGGDIPATTGNHICRVSATVTTSDATDVAKTTATLNGAVTPGEDVIDEKGFEWKKTTESTYTDLVSNSTSDTFTANLTGLTANTSYTFRAYAKVGATKTYGAAKTFTTLDIIHAEVSTLNATDVDHTVATLNGVVIAGDDVIAEKGFEWKETASGTYADVVCVSTDDTISANLTGLTPNTGYTFRAYAKIGTTKKYGAEYTFTTVEATLNIHRWIDIKVSTRENIKLGFAANDPTISIKVVYSGTSQTINGLTTDPSSQQVFYTGYNNSIRIYGDLSGLDCSGNGYNLSTIDASNNTELEKLICDRNWLWRLDVSKNTALSQLSCNKNQLDTLDVSNNTALHTLSCNNNRLTMLDVSNNTALRVLNCYGNRLTVQAWDKIYCDLPEITAPEFGTMYPIENANSGDSAIIKRTSSQNAINKGWKLQYAETSQSIPATTGNYICGTVIPATVTTLDATNVSYTTATLNSVVAPGSNIINEIGFKYKETDGGTYSGIMGNYTTDEVAIEINNLIPATNYTFKAYAILGTDTIFGAEKTFTTQIPEVNMERYIDITVMQDSILSFGFAGKAENTGVKLVSGTNTQYALVGEFTTPISNYQAKGTTIRVYGDVTGLDCNFNGEKITGLDFAHNKEMKEIFSKANINVHYLKNK